MPRAFVAIDLDDVVRRELVSAGRELRAAAPAWAGEKWVAPGNLHVTLRFLGDVPDGDVHALADAVGGSVAGIEPFRLSATRVRAVPSAGRANMIWAELADVDGGAGALAAALEPALAPFVAEEARPFRAHVTLVRARRPRRVSPDALAAAGAQLGAHGDAMSVPHVTLYSSTLTDHGPVYEVLGRYVLGRA